MNLVGFLVAMFSLLLVSCESQNPEHFPDPYNKEVERTMFKNYFPKQINNSVAISGNSKAIRPLCPVVSKGDEYITIEYEFESGVDPKEMALLNVYMEKRECEISKCRWKAVADNYFLPNPYSNKARIKNYFPKGEYRVWYGFYLKKDSLKDFPKFYKTTCYLSIK